VTYPRMAVCSGTLSVAVSGVLVEGSDRPERTIGALGRLASTTESGAAGTRTVLYRLVGYAPAPRSNSYNLA
jgi:hypothetical protein